MASNASKLVKSFGLIAATVGLAACSSTSSVSGTTATETGVVQTRVALMDSCPVARGGGEHEAALGGALAAALIPALIDVSMDAVGTALEEAAKEETLNFSSRTNGDFYKAEFVPAAWRSEKFELKQHTANGCIVVVHGRFLPADREAEIDAKTKFVDVPYKDARARTILARTFGLVSEPWFYYEGRISYSHDSSAFRIQTAFADYRRTLKDGGSGTRGMVLTFQFATPSADGKGSAFAATSIPLDHLETSTSLATKLLTGTSLAVTGGGQTTAYGSSWMPLPALSDGAKTILGLAGSRRASLDALILKSEVDYKTLLNKPNGADRLEAVSSDTVNSEVDRELVKVDAEIGRLKANIEAGRAVPKSEKELAEVVERKTALKTLREAKSQIEQAAKLVAVDESYMSKVTPFTLTATVSETRNANKLLQFLASVFKSAKPDIKTALKNEFDPKTKQTLKEAAEVAEVARINDANTKRKDAILAVLGVQSKQIALDSLTSAATASAVQTARVELRTAEIDAEIKCQAANRLGISPPECAPYL